MNNIILETKALKKEYGKGEVKTLAIASINLKIYEGELLVILGSSGCGKSTLLNMLGGMDSATAGKVIYHGKNGEAVNLSELGDKELTEYRREAVGFVFQAFNLIPELTARENVALTAASDEDTDRALLAAGLSGNENKYPSQLSGGEQQRVSIARALAKNSRVLLCDEPTGALDFETGKQILEELEKLRRDGKTVIIVTHNSEIAKMADRVIHMKNGRIISEEKNDRPLTAKELSW